MNTSNDIENPQPRDRITPHKIPGKPWEIMKWMYSKLMTKIALVYRLLQQIYS